MELKQIYDTVRSHLLLQMKQSIDAAGIYMYRGDNGMKCAIGCLIPDQIYVADMEGDIDQMLTLWPDHPFHDGDVAFMEDLQYIHDTIDPEFWELHLDGLKEKWSL